MSNIEKLAELSKVTISVGGMYQVHNLATYSSDRETHMNIFDAVNLLQNYRKCITNLQNTAKKLEDRIEQLDMPEKATGISSTKRDNANRKKHDGSQFTQMQYDCIQKAYAYFKEHNINNPTEKLTQADLCARLNTRLRLHKSKSSYGTIWNNHITRESLPKGTIYWKQENKE